MTAVCESLRFGSRQGRVPAEVAASLTESRYLAYLPSRFDPGEQGQFRNVRDCQVAGPHVHIRRRLNANGALAKSRFSRWIPVSEDLWL